MIDRFAVFSKARRYSLAFVLALRDRLVKHDLNGAMDGNAAKAEVGSPARVLDIFNAWRPGRDSIAERAHEGWESSSASCASDPVRALYARSNSLRAASSSAWLTIGSM